MERPKIITVLSIFFWIWAILVTWTAISSSKTLVCSFYYPYVNGYASLGELFTSIPPITLLIMIGILVLNFAMIILLAITGWGLWKLRKWARKTAIICSILLGSINLVMTIAMSFRGNFEVPYIFLVQIPVLWVLFRKDIKAVFENADQSIGVTV